MNSYLNYLNELSESLSHDIVRELIVIFEKQYRENSPKFETYVREKNYEEASRLAHTMRSSAANIGAIEMADLYRELENNTKANLNDKYIQLIESQRLLFNEAILSWTERMQSGSSYEKDISRRR